MTVRKLLAGCALAGAIALLAPGRLAQARPPQPATLEQFVSWLVGHWPMTRVQIINALQQFSPGAKPGNPGGRAPWLLRRQGGFRFSDAPPVREIALSQSGKRMTGVAIMFAPGGCYRAYRVSGMFGPFDRFSVLADSPHTYHRGIHTPWGRVSVAISGGPTARRSALVDRHCVLMFSLEFEPHQAQRRQGTR